VSGGGKRQHPRFAVHLKVRFAVAREFVVEYAENLSAGGVFVRGAHHLAPLDETEVDIELPGLGRFTVQGKVAHVCGPEMAARIGRSAGAGIEILSSPPAFQDALLSYLHLLGRRREHVVMVALAEMRALLDDAGYQAVDAPEPDGLLQAIARLDAPLAGIVVHESRARPYRQAAQRAGAGEIVQACRGSAEIGEVLARLDNNL
jgi:hypothetical protein